MSSLHTKRLQQHIKQVYGKGVLVRLNVWLQSYFIFSPTMATSFPLDEECSVNLSETLCRTELINLCGISALSWGCAVAPCEL